MKNRSGEKIKMPTLDELMGIAGEENANELEINRIHNFANHPFKVVDDEEMDELVESIEKNGILVAIFRRYTLILEVFDKIIRLRIIFFSSGVTHSNICTFLFLFAI